MKTTGHIRQRERGLEWQRFGLFSSLIGIHRAVEEDDLGGDDLHILARLTILLVAIDLKPPLDEHFAAFARVCVDRLSQTIPAFDFQNIDELKQLLLTDKDQLARALAVKLVTYATGRPPQAADLPAIDAIVARVRPKNYGLRALVHEIVQSDLFRHK